MATKTNEGHQSASLERRVMRAVEVFVRRYREQPSDIGELVRNGDKINAAMARIIREWTNYEKVAVKTSVQTHRTRPAMVRGRRRRLLPTMRSATGEHA